MEILNFEENCSWSSINIRSGKAESNLIEPLYTCKNRRWYKFFDSLDSPGRLRGNLMMNIPKMRPFRDSDIEAQEKALNSNLTDNNKTVPLPGGHVVIREAQPGDAPAMARINVATWRDSYGKFLPRQLMEELSCSQKQTEIENFFVR